MSPSLTPAKPSRYTAFALTVLVHLLLLGAWHIARKAPLIDNGESAEAMQWVDIRPPAPLKIPPPRPQVVPKPPLAQKTTPVAPVASTPPAAQAPTPATPPAMPNAAPAPAPALSAYELMEQAKRSLGKIDKTLIDGQPRKGITAPVVSSQNRLEKGMQAAADAAPNRWFEAPKVTEIIDPGPYARRRYRVVGARGTYCITVESNHAPDGIDTMQKGIQQKITNCEENEQAATKQKW